MVQTLGPRPQHGARESQARFAPTWAVTSKSLPSLSTPLSSESTTYREATNVASDSEDESDLDDPPNGPTFLHRWLAKSRDNSSLPRLVGKSSMFSLIQTAFELKGEHDGRGFVEPIQEIMKLMQQRPVIWDFNTVRPCTTERTARLINHTVGKSRFSPLWRAFETRFV